jgi:hypothetical protein
MNNDFNRNTRTLIVSFTVAIMALIPLRFVEVGQTQNGVYNQVLGDETVLENTQTNEELPVLEEPYATIEEQGTEVLGEQTVQDQVGTDCIAPADAENLLVSYQEQIDSGNLDEATVSQFNLEMSEVVKNTCK